MRGLGLLWRGLRLVLDVGTGNEVGKEVEWLGSRDNVPQAQNFSSPLLPRVIKSEKQNEKKSQDPLLIKNTPLIKSFHSPKSLGYKTNRSHPLIV
jgi:hypothetical protein